MEPEGPTDSLPSGPTQAEIRDLNAFWKGLSEPSVSDRFLRLVDEELAIVGFPVFPDGAQGSEPESVAEARVAFGCTVALSFRYFDGRARFRTGVRRHAPRRVVQKHRRRTQGIGMRGAVPNRSRLGGITTRYIGLSRVLVS